MCHDPGMRALAVALGIFALSMGVCPLGAAAEPVVSKREAHTIAERQVGCGYVEAEPRDSSRHWAFTAYVGYVPTLDPNPIFVDKETGQVSWAGPTIPGKDR